MTNAGSLSLPRNGTGARYGVSVSISTRSCGKARAASRSESARPEGTKPGKEEEEAAERNRSEIRRIGLDQHAIVRQGARDFAQRVGATERHDAGERDVVAGVEESLRCIERLRVRVQYAARIAARQNPDHVLRRLAVVNDDRLVQSLGKIDVALEHFALHVA